MKITLTIEIEVDVIGTFSKGEPEQRYMANGDVGHDGSPDELEINKIIWHDTDIYPLLNKDNFDFYELSLEMLTKIKEE